MSWVLAAFLSMCWISRCAIVQSPRDFLLAFFSNLLLPCAASSFRVDFGDACVFLWSVGKRLTIAPLLRHSVTALPCQCCKPFPRLLIVMPRRGRHVALTFWLPASASLLSPCPFCRSPFSWSCRTMHHARAVYMRAGQCLCCMANRYGMTMCGHNLLCRDKMQSHA